MPRSSDLKSTPELEYEEPAWKTITPHMWISLLAAIFGNAINGTGYAFSAWSDSIKTLFHYNQAQTLLVGSLGNVGQYLGPLNGILFDVFGTRITCVIAATLMFIGNFLMYMTTTGHIGGLKPASLQGFVYMIGQTGTQCLYMATLSTNVKVLPAEYRALVVGVLTGLFGLSATFFTGIYNGPFNGTNLAGYQLFLTICQSSIALMCAFVMIPIAGHRAEPRRRPEYASLLLHEKEEAKPEILQESAVKRVVFALRDLVTTWLFWVIWVTFFLGVGAGLLHNNNYSQLTKALNGGDADTNAVTIMVTAFSVSNFIGRVATGGIDYVPIRRGWFFTGGLLLMALGHLFAALLFTEGKTHFPRLYGITIMIGLAYGMMWISIPTIISEYWGTRNFAQNWGWVIVAPAAATYAFNGVAGYLYDREALKHPSPISDGIDTECIGVTCFRNAYFFAAGMAALGALLSLLIIPKTEIGGKAKAKLSEKHERRRTGRL